MMSTLTAPVRRQTPWEVPDYEVHTFRPAQRGHAVVVPVLNEGERIRAQLRTMRELSIDEAADIVLVDGGSTDGALQPDFLREMHVRALLVKTGPGKLSAQLRCAYAWCLEQNYRGIISIDGNNKDNPSAIPAMIRELESGVAFVQGSRFLAGGRAVNTPLLRLLAIRLIHAPLLSLASGFWWTDTTNGFRGYRRELLLDERIRPFRNVFETYELLSYLTVRAPQLGYVCKEIPVERRYPARGKVPTKIKGWKGNAALLRVLLQTVLGRFHPK